MAGRVTGTSFLEARRSWGGRPRESAPRRGLAVAAFVGARGRVVAPLLVEGEDLELDGEVDLAERDAGGRAHDGGGEVQDRRDARVDEPVGHLLRRVCGRRDDPDGDAARARDLREIVERFDGEVT